MTDNSERHRRFAEAFSACAPTFRDTNFSDDIIKRHKVGLFLRERGFCDSSNKFGGFLGNHRYLIVSGNARCIDSFAQNPNWGFCLLPSQSLFKVIGIHVKAGRTQTTLLEVKDEFIRYFCNQKLNEIEISFVEQAQQNFEEALDRSPVKELDDPDWLERLEFPLGMSTRGEYFPLFDDPDAVPEGEIENAAIALAYLARVHLANGDIAHANVALQQEKDMRARMR